MKTATHANGTKVKFKPIKDFLGNTLIQVTFDNGEVTDMLVKRFAELFTVNS